jgi:type IV pilus assembly protein PilA
VRSLIIFLVVGVCPLFYLGRRHAADRVRRYFPETAALKAVQTLNTAQVQYNSQFGRYARLLSELGPSGSNLIASDLASGERQGYRFQLTVTPAGYSIQALPVVFGQTGSRTFYTDQTLVVRENFDPKPATRDSREVGTSRGRGE